MPLLEVRKLKTMQEYGKQELRERLEKSEKVQEDGRHQVEKLARAKETDAIEVQELRERLAKSEAKVEELAGLEEELYSFSVTGTQD